MSRRFSTKAFTPAFLLFLIGFARWGGGAERPQDIGIACLGRIVPEDGVFHLTAPYTLQGPSLIAQLFVREGEPVKREQVLAVTHSRPVAEAALAEARSQVEVAKARLAQVMAGEKATDIAAQEAEVQRLTAESQNAERIYNRQVQLRKTGAVSEAELDATKSSSESRRNQLDAASKRLASIREVRQTDTDYATALVEAAVAAARRAEAELAQTQLRAPVDGQVIKIHAFPGEQAGPEGVLEMAKTQSMFVTAEVYETDIRSVKLKQRAEIEAAFLKPDVAGTVEEIGLAVRKNAMYGADPAAFADTRVVEVKIRLEDSSKAAGLIGAQVTVRILP
ncbi:MAG: HlyD family efflux transporter periplasmic adaptor subunit [Chthoniobacterales bacterium]